MLTETVTFYSSTGRRYVLTFEPMRPVGLPVTLMEADDGTLSDVDGHSWPSLDYFMNSFVLRLVNTVTVEIDAEEN